MNEIRLNHMGTIRASRPSDWGEDARDPEYQECSECGRPGQWKRDLCKTCYRRWQYYRQHEKNKRYAREKYHRKKKSLTNRGEVV